MQQDLFGPVIGDQLSDLELFVSAEIYLGGRIINKIIHDRLLSENSFMVITIFSRNRYFRLNSLSCFEK